MCGFLIFVRWVHGTVRRCRPIYRVDADLLDVTNAVRDGKRRTTLERGERLALLLVEIM